MSRAWWFVSVPRSDRVGRITLGLALLVAPAIGFARPLGAQERAATHPATRTVAPRSMRTWSLASSGATAAGLAYSRLHDRFFALDTSTPEGSSPTRILAMDGYGDVIGSFDLPLARPGSGDLVYDEAHGRLLLHDDGFVHLYAIGLDAEGRPDPATLAMVETPRVGPLRPAGMTIDPGTGSLFVLDRLTHRVLRFTPQSLSSDDPSLAGRGDAGWIQLGELSPRALRGLAYDPIEAHLFVLEPAAGVLYELTLEGAVVAGFDLEGVGVSDPGGLMLAPSGDRTDDPSALGLYVTGAGSRITELSLAVQEPISMSAALPTPVLVRTIDTSIWADPSPDPSGLAYDAATGRLLLVDGEVEEESYWHNVNYYELSLTGTYLRGASLFPYSDEPVGVARGSGNIVFASDDDARAIFVIDRGADRLVGTADDQVTTIDTETFGSGDPEGVTFDAAHGLLYLSDGANSEIYVIGPGANGLFDGVDDAISHFDVSRYRGDGELEAVEFHPQKGTLFLLGDGNDALFELTTTGALVNSWDLGSLAPSHGAGMAFAPGSSAPGEWNLYISDRRVDNDSQSSENDGLIYELSLGGSPPPPPPGSGPVALQIRVNASNNDAEESASRSVSLSGSDLELVLDSNLQTVGLRFPGVAIDRNAVIDSAFIQFTADETHNGATNLTIFGQAADNPAVFASSSGNVSSRPRTAASMGWTPPAWTANQVLPAQRTPNLAPILNQILSRSGWARGNALAFVVTGTGRRIAKAFEAGAATAPLLLVYVGNGSPPPPPPPPTNQPPSVDAGPDRTIVLPAQASLDGTVHDDGLPAPPSVTTQWTKASGPGTVTFANAGAVDTQAGFSEAGRYVLRLTANDGALGAGDTVVVQAQAPGSIQATVERRVATGNDDAEQKNNSMSLDSSDLELVLDGSAQTIGLRFTNLNLPPGANVTNAWIQFKADETQSVATSLTLRAQAADNAAIFSSSANVVSRPLTTASVAWAPPAWTSGQTTAAQRTPDLKDLLNELTHRSTWTAASPVVIVISGTGHRTARAFEGEAAAAPLFHIEYQQ